MPTKFEVSSVPHNEFLQNDVSAREFLETKIRQLRDTGRGELAAILEKEIEGRINKVLSSLAYSVGRGEIKVRLW